MHVCNPWSLRPYTTIFYHPPAGQKRISGARLPICIHVVFTATALINHPTRLTVPRRSQGGDTGEPLEPAFHLQNPPPPRRRQAQPCRAKGPGGSRRRRVLLPRARGSPAGATRRPGRRVVRGGAGAPGRRPRVFFGESAAVVAAWAAARLVRAAASSTLRARPLGPDLGLAGLSCRRACAGAGR